MTEDVRDVMLSFDIDRNYKLLGHWYCIDIYFNMLLREEQKFLETREIGPIIDELIGTKTFKRDYDTVKEYYDSARLLGGLHIPKIIYGKYKSYRRKRLIGILLLIISALLAMTEVFL